MLFQNLTKKCAQILSKVVNVIYTLTYVLEQCLSMFF